MVSKKHISYKWRLFLPSAICLWLVIGGMFAWQAWTVTKVRTDMAFDQLDMIALRVVDLFEKGDTAEVRSYAEFSSKYFDDAYAYDPLTIWVQPSDDNEPARYYGRFLRDGFRLPIDTSGIMTVPHQFVNTAGVEDTKFLYSVKTTSGVKNKNTVYVMLPYTKRVADNISGRQTSFWLIVVAIGVFVTIILYISISYFGRNIHMLKVFSYEASKNPNFVPPADIEFSNDELGDITRQILDIYNQRMDELDRREEEHKTALSAIDEKNRLKRELTSNINHELKTPVGVVQGYIDTIVANPDMDPELRDNFILKAQNGVQRLVAIIKDITEITKLESGGKLVNLTKFNMRELAFTFADMLKEGNVLQDKMTFTYNLPKDCYVYGNDSLMQTVLLNFVKNAVAYSRGTECHLIMVGETDKTVSFKFYDNGVGVAPEHLPHMFDRFYRVNAGRSRATGGTGLGLAIVEVTIKSFGGSIEVSNHFPTGLEFNFTLFKSRPANPGDTVDDYLDK